MRAVTARRTDKHRALNFSKGKGQRNDEKNPKVQKKRHKRLESIRRHSRAKRKAQSSAVQRACVRVYVSYKVRRPGEEGRCGWRPLWAGENLRLPDLGPACGVFLWDRGRKVRLKDDRRLLKVEGLRICYATSLVVHREAAKSESSDDFLACEPPGLLKPFLLCILWALS